MSAVLELLPAHYIGVWQRLSLQTESELDTATRVYWLQTRNFHADIRVPADRPDFRDKSSLQDFSRDELLLLARQKGFAGMTLVQENLCVWQRHIDYQPPTGQRDAGLMEFSGNTLIETGADAPYREVWQRLPESRGEDRALRFLEEPLDNLPRRKGFLVTAGDYFLFARDRTMLLPPDSSLEAMARDMSRETLLAAVDFELSFGRIAQGSCPWEITLSTLPFREGQALFSAGETRRSVRDTEPFVEAFNAGNGRHLRRYWFPE